MNLKCDGVDSELSHKHNKALEEHTTENLIYSLTNAPHVEALKVVMNVSPLREATTVKMDSQTSKILGSTIHFSAIDPLFQQYLNNLSIVSEYTTASSNL